MTKHCSGLTLAGLLFALLAACSADPRGLTNEAFQALNRGDAESALARYEQALAAMDNSHPDFHRAALGRCQALCRIEPDLARKEFLAMAAALGERAAPEDFSIIAGELCHKRAFVQAVDVMDAGNKLFPANPKMQAVKDKVVAESVKAADPAAVQALKNLGYLGGD